MSPALPRALAALRRAAATGRDAQTVTVRRGYLRELLDAYDRANGCPSCERLGRDDCSVPASERALWCHAWTER